jgi:DNA-binding CsgD family transcriptional regulator
MYNIQSGPDNWNKLTAREIEIIRSAAIGSSIKKTASDLKISVNTVSNHRKKIIKKLACGNISNAVFQLGSVQRNS